MTWVRPKGGRAVTRMAVITPSFAPDLELCARLNRSLLALSPESVIHDIVVPRRDLELFGQLAGPRTHVRCEADLLPRSFVKLPLVNFTVNLRRPLPPVRGWILQQIIKLAAAADADADVVLLVDSDIEFVRSFTPASFVRDGVVRFYRKPNEIDDRLPRHIVWHRVARALLGLAPPTLPLTDYICSLLAWDPTAVRMLLDRVEHVTRRPWWDSIGAQLHFSEWTLYGVFVDEVLGLPANSNASDRSLCHAYWEVVPLDDRTAADFVFEVRPDDIAIMISAKSRTPVAVRRAAFAALRATQPSPHVEQA
jgi:hypothetical protein